MGTTDPSTSHATRVLATIDEALKLLRGARWLPGSRTLPWALVQAETAAMRLLAAAHDQVEALARVVDEHHTARQAPAAVCRCKGGDHRACALHPIGHYHRPHCCDAPEEQHRHMTGAEHDAEFPRLFERRVRVGDATYEVSCRRYWDGPGVTLVHCYDDQTHDGLAFDLPGEALAALLPALAELAAAWQAD